MYVWVLTHTHAHTQLLQWRLLTPTLSLPAWVWVQKKYKDGFPKDLKIHCKALLKFPVTLKMEITSVLCSTTSLPTSWSEVLSQRHQPQLLFCFDQRYQHKSLPLLCLIALWSPLCHWDNVAFSFSQYVFNPPHFTSCQQKKRSKVGRKKRKKTRKGMKRREGYEND